MHPLLRVEGMLRKVLARNIDPGVFTRLYSSARPWALEKLAKMDFPPIDPPPYEVQVGEATCRNDLGNAAGFDKDGTLLGFNYRIGAGFGVVGTVLNKKHKGKLIRTAFGRANPWTPLPNSSSAINTLGLPSEGIDVALGNIKRFQDKYQPENFPIGLSVMGHPLQEGEEKENGLVECVGKGVEVVDFIEVNESCPNTEHDQEEGIERRLKRITRVRDEANRYVPVFVKLADYGNVENTVGFMTGLNVDGIVGVNTQKNYDELRKRVRPNEHKLFDYYTKHHQGGVSGNIISVFSISELQKARNEIEKQGSHLKLIHVGGISTDLDVEASRSFAFLREWYTGLMERLGDVPIDKVYRSMLGEIPADVIF